MGEDGEQQNLLAACGQDQVLAIGYDGHVESGSLQASDGPHVSDLDQPPSTRGASWTKAQATFLKAMLGAGMLSLPYAFANSGWLAGVTAYISVGLLCTYTELLLLKVSMLAAP